MPQIANQDYNSILQNGAGFSYRNLASVANAIVRNTIFDFILKVNHAGPGEMVFGRVLSIFKDERGAHRVFYIDSEGVIAYFDVRQTPEQYAVMADIVDGGGDPGSLEVDGYGNLTDGEYIISVNGKSISVVLDDDTGNIKSYTITGTDVSNYAHIDIPEEDLPGLIGLFAGN